MTTTKHTPKPKTSDKCLSLSFVWGVRAKLWAEADKLETEADELWAEADKLRAEADKLRAEADKREAEADKLRAEADELWAGGTLEAYGNISLKWAKSPTVPNQYECHLSNGLVFKPKT